MIDGSSLGKLMTIREIAEAGGVCERTVRRWIKDGLLPVRRRGGGGRVVRVAEHDWFAFIARS